MIDEYDVLTLFAEANPVPDDALRESADLALDVAERASDEPRVLAFDQQVRADAQRRGVFIGIAAAVAVFASALVLFQLVAPEGPVADDRSVVTEAPEPSPAPVGDWLATSTGFVNAWGTGDTAGAESFLTSDADLSRLWGGQEDWRLATEFMQGTGFQVLLDSCERQESPQPETTSVRCFFDYHWIRSDEIGLGPFTGSYLDLTIPTDRGIDEVVLNQEFIANGFTEQVWKPFSQWVATTYPGDVALMYAGSNQLEERISPDSIALWEDHSREYVQVAAPGREEAAVSIAERFMEARNTNNFGEPLSLLAHETENTADSARSIRVPLHFDRQTDDFVGQKYYGLGELAMAFQIEQLYEYRFDGVECRLDSDPMTTDYYYVLCTYVLDSRMHEIAGLQPVESSVRLRVVSDGGIDSLSLPWLNIGGAGDDYWPAELAGFVRWLSTEHPAAFPQASPNPREVDGTLFEAPGGELTHLLTPRAVDILGAYLDEYESSATD